MTKLPTVPIIGVTVIERPEYQHENWERPHEWITDNIDRLGSYYIDLARIESESSHEIAQEIVAHYLFMTPVGRKRSTSDFRHFCLAQRDICEQEAQQQLAEWDAERADLKSLAQESHQW